MTIWSFAKFSYYPILIRSNLLPVLSNKELYLLIFITGCIAASGYLLNDIVDIKTDHINMKRSYISSRIEKIIALCLYAVLTLSPIPFAYSLASEINHPEYIWLYFLVTGLLFIYNIYLKGVALIGNLLISVLCASVVIVFLLGELETIITLKTINAKAYDHLLWISSFYIVFAFICNLIREIIKDIEDVNGDQKTGIKTLPIVLGLLHTKKVIISLQLITLIIMPYWISYGYQLSFFNIILLTVLLISPAIYLLYFIFKAEDVKEYSIASLYYKFWMFLGLVFIVTYELTNA